MHILGNYKEILFKVCPRDQFRISIKVLGTILSSKCMIGYILVLLKIKEKNTTLEINEILSNYLSDTC